MKKKIFRKRIKNLSIFAELHKHNPSLLKEIRRKIGENIEKIEEEKTIVLDGYKLNK